MTRKSIDYNVDMTFILNNNNNVDVAMLSVCLSVTLWYCIETVIT